MVVEETQAKEVSVWGKCRRWWIKAKLLNRNFSLSFFILESWTDAKLPHNNFASAIKWYYRISYMKWSYCIVWIVCICFFRIKLISTIACHMGIQFPSHGWKAQSTGAACLKLTIWLFSPVSKSWSFFFLSGSLRDIIVPNPYKGLAWTQSTPRGIDLTSGMLWASTGAPGLKLASGPPRSCLWPEFLPSFWTCWYVHFAMISLFSLWICVTSFAENMVPCCANWFIWCMHLSCIDFVL